MTEETKTVEYGIEETMDVLAWIQGMADRMLLAKLDDGEIDTKEIVAALMAEAPGALSAFVGASDIDNELGNLSEDERKKVLEASMRIVQTFGSLFSKEPQKTAE